jgi:hypothetical protein
MDTAQTTIRMDSRWPARRDGPADPACAESPIMASMDATSQTQARWFYFTPGRFVIGLLAVEVLLWLSERFGWLGWHKGYAVLTAVAVVGVAMILMLLWFAVALAFRRRFPFILWPLLLLAVAVALPLSWLAVEMRKAREQKEAVDTIWKAEGDVVYNWQWDLSRRGMETQQPDEPPWLRAMLEDEFFSCITQVTSGPTKQLANLPPDVPQPISTVPWDDTMLEPLAKLRELQWLDLRCTDTTDAGLEHLSGLRKLRGLSLDYTKVTDAGVAKLQQALPNCKITR